MDLISNLPEDVLHEILRRLPAKDVLRTCVLSKSWRDKHARSPFLNLNDLFFIRRHPNNHKKLFKKHASRSIKKRRSQKLATSEFRLTMYSHQRSDEFDISHWLYKLRKVKGLQINMLPDSSHFFFLPCWMVNSNHLTNLNLLCCDMAACRSINCPNLQQVNLSACLHVGERFIQRLISGCPSLENLILLAIHGISSFIVSSSRLKRLELRRCSDLLYVAIRSPELEFFCYEQSTLHHNGSCELTLTPNNQNTSHEVILEFPANITSSWLQEQIPKCEELVIDRISDFQDTKISSQKFRKLSIKRCKNMTKMPEIDCPNLRSFAYLNNCLPFQCFNNNNSELQDVRFRFCLDEDDVWLHKLKGLVASLSSYHKELIKLVLSFENNQDVFVYDGLSESMLLPMLDGFKNLKPTVIISSVSNSLQLDNLLEDIFGNWPGVSVPYKAVNVASTHHNNNESNFSQVLYEKLSTMKLTASCCDLVINQCWRHDLSNIKVDDCGSSTPAVSRFFQFQPCQITRILLEWTPIEES